MNLFSANIRTFAGLMLISLALLLQSCTCLTCDDDGPVDENANVWEEVSLNALDRIIALHTTQDELYAFSKNEFFQINGATQRIVQRRRFLPQYENLGQPAIQDDIFVRGIKEIGTGEELVEFSLVNDQSSVVRIPVDSLLPRLLALEFDAATVGAFNDDGDIYVQPVIQRMERRLGMLVFSVRTNQDKTEFTNVNFIGLINFPDVRELPRVVSSIRYFDDYFYISTKLGLYRMSESGVLEALIQNSTDIRDVFKFQGSFYATQVSSAPMFISNTGSNWRTSGIVTDLRLVDVFDNYLVSQELEGWQYRITSDISEPTEPLKLNENFDRVNNDEFFGVAKFGDKYYLGLRQNLYTSDSLRVANQ